MCTYPHKKHLYLNHYAFLHAVIMHLGLDRDLHLFIAWSTTSLYSQLWRLRRAGRRRRSPSPSLLEGWSLERSGNQVSFRRDHADRFFGHGVTQLTAMRLHVFPHVSVIGRGPTTYFAGVRADAGMLAHHMLRDDLVRCTCRKKEKKKSILISITV